MQFYLFALLKGTYKNHFNFTGKFLLLGPFKDFLSSFPKFGDEYFMINKRLY